MQRTCFVSLSGLLGLSGAVRRRQSCPGPTRAPFTRAVEGKNLERIPHVRNSSVVKTNVDATVTAGTGWLRPVASEL